METKTRFVCDDCPGQINHDWYHLKPEVWREVMPTVKGLLHINCFEKRLGRPLAQDDFSSAPVNSILHWAFERARNEVK